MPRIRFTIHKPTKHSQPKPSEYTHSVQHLMFSVVWFFWFMFLRCRTSTYPIKPNCYLLFMVLSLMLNGKNLNIYFKMENGNFFNILRHMM